ncbi:MAG TPA: DUF937 domain-containing protein, partial [Myxococcota bacterium]|nr:DUF937 domain-containing protein [Myxococcota bacterium]
MAASLLECGGEYFTPDLIGRVGVALGEAPGAVSKGLDAVLPALLAGVVERAREPHALHPIYALVSDAAVDPALARSPSRLLAALEPESGQGGAASARLLALLFGPRTGGLVSAVAGHAGIQPASAEALLRLAAVIVLSFLADRVRKEGLGLPAFAALLSSQRDCVQRAIPVALAGSLSPPPTAARRASSRSARSGARSGGGWLLPAGVALGIIAGVWSVVRGTEERAAEVRTVPPVGSPAAVAAAPPWPGAQRHRLPSGVEIAVPEEGSESALLAYLRAPDASPPAAPFELERVSFEEGSAALLPGSSEQLANVAEIL